MGTRARHFVAGRDRLVRATRLAAILGPFVFGFGLRDPSPTKKSSRLFKFPGRSCLCRRCACTKRTRHKCDNHMFTFDPRRQFQQPRAATPHVDPFQAFAPPAHNNRECSRRAPLCVWTVSGFGRVGFPFPWGCARLRAVIGLKSNTTARGFCRAMTRSHIHYLGPTKLEISSTI